jgi:hypothetical protein
VGIEDSDLSGVTSASEFFLPKGTGTMAEGVSGIPDAYGEPPAATPRARPTRRWPRAATSQPPGEGGGW